jgi:hypothetical protein
MIVTEESNERLVRRELPVTDDDVDKTILTYLEAKLLFVNTMDTLQKL